MARMYFDDDADLRHIEGRTVCIVGFGNQGRSQALNLRDSGLTVIVGSRRDRSYEQAEADGFAVFPVTEAAARADIVFLLVPDEVMPEVFETEIAPGLRSGGMLVFASGYNIAFDLITPSADVDVVLIAPRMIGSGVRETFLSGEGFPSLIAVHQAAGEAALDRTLASARGSVHQDGGDRVELSRGGHRGPLRGTGGIPLRGAPLLRGVGRGRVQPGGGHAGVLRVGGGGGDRQGVP